jgi:sulfane dehydrogenase subunit SoxC
VRKVEVSTDGGRSWAEAALTGAQRSRALVRFRYPWEWNGAPAQLQSRATDEKGELQPPRREWVARYAPDARFHNNSIVTWAVDGDGSVKHVYA